jgi:tripartite-type tricarboxylate transporter receptor subunit TctC
MSALLQQQGMKMTHVPYKSSAEVARDLSAGTLQIGWVDTSSSQGLIQSGKIRPLAIGATYKAPANPEVLTFNELGYPMNLNGWLGAFATAGTPNPIVKAVNAEINKLLSTEEANKRLIVMNVANAPTLSTEQFAQMVRTELQNWRKVVLDNGIKVD